MVLLSMPFIEEDIKHLVTSTGGKKRKAIDEADSNEKFTTEPKSECEYAPIQLPAFDVSTKKN